jgi:hypothetical protein
MSENLHVKRLITGAALLGYSALTYAYISNHHFPLDPSQLQMSGVRASDCPKIEEGATTDFTCLQISGEIISFRVPTDQLTNHGQFAMVENTLDAHKTAFATTGGFSSIPGLILIAASFKRNRRSDEDATDFQLPPVEPIWVVSEKQSVAGFDDIPLLPYAPEYPVVHPDDF